MFDGCWIYPGAASLRQDTMEACATMFPQCILRQVLNKELCSLGTLLGTVPSCKIFILVFWNSRSAVCARTRGCKAKSWEFTLWVPGIWHDRITTNLLQCGGERATAMGISWCVGTRNRSSSHWCGDRESTSASCKWRALDPRTYGHDW